MKYLLSAGSCLMGAVASLTSCSSQKPKDETPARPNIIYILADDLGIGDIQPYGQKLIQTPNLNRLQEQGLRFTQAYAGTAVSAPSRCSLMTGLHTGHAFVRGNKGVDPEGQVAMPEGTFTMATMLKEQGYATGCFGKWGLGYPGSVSDPTKVGFDQFFGYNCQTLAHDYYPDHLWNNEARIDLPQNYEQREVTYSADTIHQQALQFIRQHADQPFFTFLSYTLPHAELILPHDSVYDMYCRMIPEADEVPYAPKDPNRRGAYGATARPLASFASMVTRFDRYVGQRSASRRWSQSRLFRQLWPLSRHQARPLRGRHPYALPDPLARPHQGCGYRLRPHHRLLGYASHLCPAGRLREVAPDRRHLICSDTFGSGGTAEPREPLLGVPVFELYDLSNDIHEDHNVAAEHPDIAAQLNAIIDSCHTESELFDFGREKTPKGITH